MYQEAEHREKEQRQSPFRSQAERDKLVLDHLRIVKRVAYRIVSRLPETIQVEDLISVGTMGLIDAAEKFDPSKGKSFAAYSELRIKGSILDELRCNDSLSRGSRRMANTVGQTVATLEGRLGRKPTEEEIAKEMGIELQELQAMMSQTRSLVFLDIQDATGTIAVQASEADAVDAGHTEFQPYRELAEKSMKEQLTEAIADLPEKLRLVLSLYYFDELNYKEIGKVLDLSESRISQLHSKAILKVKKAIAAQESVL